MIPYPTALELQRNAARQHWLDLQNGGRCDAPTLRRAALEYASAQKLFGEECQHLRGLAGLSS